jgi:hypothetical protein
MIAVCKVCELVDNNTTPKEVVYCETCKEYICKDCEPNWYRRGIAMIKSKLKL